MGESAATGDLPQRLKAARFKARLSQVELAEALGVSQPHLCKVERGDTRPSAELAARIDSWIEVSGVDAITHRDRRAAELARQIQKHSRELARLIASAGA